MKTPSSQAMKKPAIILLHAGYWFLYEILFTVFFFLSRTASLSAFESWDDWLALLATVTVAGAASFYAFYLWLVPRYLTTGRIKAFLGSGLAVSFAVAVLSTVLFSLVITVLLFALFQKLEFLLFTFQDQIWLATWFTLVTVVNGILGTIIRGFIMWYADIHEKQLLVNSKLQAELALLKAQINPHFLFNTLNNIDVLIDHDPHIASLYLNKLSDLLRYVLYETQTEWIPLTKEVEYIHKYIDLQRIRTANEDFVSLKTDGLTNNIMIPPMILVPYIENAFKFASNKKSIGAIRISIAVASSQLHFQCINNIDQKHSGHSINHNGLGNGLLERRLNLLYPNNYQLDTHTSENEYIVNLSLPVRIHEMSADRR